MDCEQGVIATFVQYLIEVCENPHNITGSV